MAEVGKYERTPEIRKKLSDAAKQRIGEKNPFFNKTHTEESKQKMSRTRTGLTLTAAQRAERKAQHTQEWLASHPDRVKEYDQKFLKPRADNNRRRRQELRKSVIVKLGGKCSSSMCRWLNTDGTLGCSDPRLLQLDHKDGGGSRERRKLSYDKMLKKALNDSTDYQLLCACCNWLKAHEQKEFSNREKYAHLRN